MFGYLQSLFAGNSKDHFIKAANHTKNVVIETANVTTYGTKGIANLAGVGVEAGVGYGLFETFAGKVMGANAGLQLTAQLNSALGNTGLQAKAIALAAYAAKKACNVLVNHSTPVLGATVLTYLALHPEYVKGAGQNFGSAAVSAAKIGINLTGAGLETAAGGVLKVKETAEDTKYYLDGHVFDRQDGKGTDGHYIHKDIGPFKEETSLDGSVFVEGWVEMSGAPSLIVNEE